MNNDEISLNKDDEGYLQELIQDYVSDSPQSRMEDLARTFRESSPSEFNTLEDFSYYFVTSINASGETRELLEYLIKKNPPSQLRYLSLIDKYTK